jgi:hypothetical protein
VRERLYGFVRFAPDRWHLSLAGGLRVMRQGSAVEVHAGRWWVWIGRDHDYGRP